MRRALAVEPGCDGGACPLRAECRSPLHNNCSGKHSGFLCTCVHLGLDHRGYVGFDHPYAGDDPRGHAGRDRARLTTSTTAPSTAARSRPMRCRSRALLSASPGWRRAKACRRTRAKAAKRLFAACMAEPFYVVGVGRCGPAAGAGGTGPDISSRAGRKASTARLCRNWGWASRSNATTVRAAPARRWSQPCWQGCWRRTRHCRRRLRTWPVRWCRAGGALRSAASSRPERSLDSSASVVAACFPGNMAPNATLCVRLPS